LQTSKSLEVTVDGVGPEECGEVRAGVGRVDRPAVRHGVKAPPALSLTGQGDGIAVSTCSFSRGAPPDAENAARVPLYSEHFPSDPHASYAQMRERFGPLVPVWLAPGVPATLVIGYWTALQILNDPEHFPADPSSWQRDVPRGCPVLPMLEKRPNALRSSGIEHARYRAANVVALGRVDLTA